MKNPYSITVCKSLADFDILAHEWQQLLARSPANHIFCTWQWQRTWWSLFHEGRELCLVTIRDRDGKLSGVAPLFRESAPDGVSLHLIGSTDLCDYLDCIVLKGREEEVFHALCSHFHTMTPQPTAVYLPSLAEGSSTLHIMEKKASQWGFRLETTVEDVSPSAVLPPSFDGYLKQLSKKNRHEIRRKIRKARSLGRLTVKRVGAVEELAQALPVFFDLHQKSTPDKESFMNEVRKEFFRKISHTLLPLGWLNLFFLQFEGTDVAALLCFAYENTIYVYNSGYDPSYGALSPGIVLLTSCIEDAIERGICGLDLLRGNESYKYHFGATDRLIYRAVLKPLPR
jgi:CelD/BcsL family acetyltransferase involved in cellulose biosynthesis